MGRVAGVINDPPRFPYTLPGVDVLEEGKLTSNNVVGSSHNPLQSFAVGSGAVSKPGGDAAGQDTLHSAGVEGSEDAGAHSKLPQPSQEEEGTCGSCGYREYRSGLRTQPCGAPVLRVSGDEVLLPILTT